MASASKFIWYELMTSDLDAAEAFYTAVVGWNAETWPGEFRYTIVKAGDTGVAGLMALPAEATAMGTPPCWVGYIQADDVDAAAARLGKAGGHVHRQPSDIPNVGRFSVVADPQGAIFILFKPTGEGMPEPAPMTPGHVGWRELYAEDWSAAFDFYTGQFGWTKGEAYDMGPMGTYQLFATGGDATGGMMDKPAQMPAPAWLYYFNVDDIDAAMKRVTYHGGQVLNGPMEVPGNAWIIQAKDPQGAMFALVGWRKQ